MAVPISAHAQPRPLPGDVGPVAGGGAFVMQTCGETASSQGWSTTLNSNPIALATGVNCPPSNRPPGFPNSFQQAGLWVSDRLGNAGGAIEANAGDRAEMTFTPVTGTITRLRYWRAIAKANDDSWQPYIALSTRANVIDTCEIAGQSICFAGGDDWYPNDTANVNRSSYRDLDNQTASSIIIGLYCRDVPPAHTCGNGFSLTNINAEIFSAFLTIAESTAPTAGTPTGSGWTTTDWAQGTLPLSLSSADSTGIYATRVYADGSLIATLRRSCSYDRPRPCTDEPGGAVGIPTADLADGAHSIEVAAVDAAGNETRVARPQPLRIDNQAPAAPLALASPSSTSQANSFSASWSLPPDSGTPIVAARFQLCQNGGCDAVQTAPSPTGVSGLALPAAGDATLRVWLVDQLGHENAAGASTLKLTYAPPAPQPDPQPQPDPTPPPTPVPTPTPVVTKVSPALKLTTVRRAGRKVTIAGKLSTKASGRVTIRYRVRQGGRTRTVTRHATIRRGAFRLTFTLSATIAKTRTATVSVAYPGDRDTRSQTRTANLRLR
ncbi:MAG TPA: hypothetical protein VK501_12860 [Baekduia sp.]|uniref:hypothetical protein n=1 Tax=Baekduia sp. TaxID=2600305 RepID=UPI002CB52FE3|nr:hypothetical protein [Baekduia sp.]HMJ34796.1 hypothetical protein [Baekduia sp.]